jgi:hypothetical protein
MTRHVAGLLLCALIVGRAGTADGTQPFATVRVEVEIVSVPDLEARHLIPQLKNKATFLAARERVQKLIEGGSAELIGFALGHKVAFEPADESLTKVWTPAGREESSGSIEQITFAGPRALLNGVYGGNVPAQSVVKAEPVPEPVQPNTNPSLLVPIDFDVEFAGPQLDIEVGVDRTTELIALAVNVSHKKVLGIEAPIGARSERVGDRKLTYPRFRDLRVQAKLYFSDGVNRLIGVFRDEAPKGGFILMLLSAKTEKLPRRTP